MTIDLTSPITGAVANAAVERPADGLEAAAASGFLAALQNLMMATQPPAAGPVAAAGQRPEGVTAHLTTSISPRARIAAPVLMGITIDAQGGVPSLEAAAVEAAVEGGPATGTALVAAPVPLVPGSAPPASNDGAAQLRDEVEAAPSSPQAGSPASADGLGKDDSVPTDSIVGLAGGGRSAEVADVVARTMPPAISQARPAAGATSPAAASGVPSNPPAAAGKHEPAQPIVPTQAAASTDRQPQLVHEGASVDSPAAERPAETAPDFMTTVEPVGSSTLAAPATLAVEEGLVATSSGPRPVNATVTGLATAVVDAVHDGESGIRVALQPEQLGRVDVDLAIGEDGRLQASFMVERPETLQLLQRDQRLLGQALGDAGILLGDGGLRFSLDEHSTDRRQSQGHENASPRAPDGPVLASTASPTPRRQALGLLDLLV